MNELVEGVLTVCPGLPPHDGAGAVGDPGPGPGHVLPVALHVALLEVGCESVQILIVGQQGVGLRPVEVGVPHPEHGQHHGDVGLQGSRLEVVVHPVGARQKVLEVIEADVECDGEADSGPKAVAAANPVPELKHVSFVNSKLLYKLGICRQSHKVVGNKLFIFG